MAKPSRLPVRTTRLPAAAVGAFALGALAIGALAVGAVIVRRLVVGKARFGAVEIDDLTVRRLHLAPLADATRDAKVRGLTSTRAVSAARR